MSEEITRGVHSANSRHQGDAARDAYLKQEEGE